MRTTKAISISLPPAELKQALRLAKRTNRSLSGLFREGLKRLQHDHSSTAQGTDYTSAQRKFIDARIAEGLANFQKGRFYGPFNNADEAIASLKAKLKQRRAAKKAKLRLP